MTEMVIYRHEADGTYWVRSVEEFEDGRFERTSLNTPAPTFTDKQGREALYCAVADLTAAITYVEAHEHNAAHGLRQTLKKVQDALATPAARPQAKTVAFYGAQCASYPQCTGGCGLGCTHEIERASAARPQADVREAQKKIRALTSALKAARPEIERQRDRCNSDEEVKPYELILKNIDGALSPHPLTLDPATVEACAKAAPPYWPRILLAH